LNSPTKGRGLELCLDELAILYSADEREGRKGVLGDMIPGREGSRGEQRRAEKNGRREQQGSLYTKNNGDEPQSGQVSRWSSICNILCRAA
jgi:hypothetical protein